MIITKNIQNELNSWLDEKEYSRLIVLVDENTKQYCLPILNIRPPFDIIEIKSGEANKTLSSCNQIWSKLLDLRVDREALFINLGGGVLSDMGAFCASCYKRGIDFINIPTTLLAQVDASIGAKTGINFNSQKNMIGLFSAAKQCFIDPFFLQTLPKRELLNGFAEVIKHGLIGDKHYFEHSIQSFVKDKIQWNQIIEKSIQLKSKIVDLDPKEKGIRKILNFGHTIGHAIESYSLKNHKNPLLHGEAIILGITGELFLSQKKINLDFQEVEKIVDRLQYIYSYLKLEPIDIDKMLKLMLNDKKSQNGKIQSILISKIGEAHFDCNIKSTEITEALNYVQTKF